MTDKDMKQTENKAPEAEELQEDDLDKVVGAGPLAFPDVSTGGGGKVSISGTKVDISASTDSEGGSMKGITSSLSGGKAQTTVPAVDVKVEGGNVGITGNPGFGSDT